MDLAKEFVPHEISEIEINPLVTSDKQCVALDILVKLASAETVIPAERPTNKIKNLLEPQSIAIAGVSQKMNSGHIILNNIIQNGFYSSRIYILHPEQKQIEGVNCYKTIQDLPERVDLLVLAIPASMVPEFIKDVIDNKKAESIIVIPGGLEEKAGTEHIVSQMNETLAKSRQSDWKGPIINGGNCLGITSKPGKYDTMFIPEYKLKKPTIEPSPLAFISQSGAFAVAMTSNLSMLNARYSITIGNQMDLTIGDYLSYLKDDPALRIFSIYIEGFKPRDGLKFIQAAKEIIDSGRTVILYLAGRTATGAQASASHTASIAGDYAVSRSLCKEAGIILTETLQDFEDLTSLFSFLDSKNTKGLNLGAISNAGFECVNIADNLNELQLAQFGNQTNIKLESIFEKSKISEIVDVHNPIDLTPMANDEAYAETTIAVLEDENVDAAVVGCVPLTAALQTLPKDASHPEDMDNENSVVNRFIRIFKETSKPMVYVVNSGDLYNPMVKMLKDNHVPTFRSADQAVRLLSTYCVDRLRRNQ